MRTAMWAIALALMIASAAATGHHYIAPAAMSAYCAPGCNSTHLGNGVCNFMCMEAKCGFDSNGGPSDCRATYGLTTTVPPRTIIATNDLDGNMRLNSTEAYTHFGLISQEVYNKNAMSNPVLGLDYYEVALAYFDEGMCSSMQSPSPAVDWAVWAQPTAFFMMAVADANGDHVLSPEEMKTTWPKLTPNQHRTLVNATGFATVKSLAAMLGNMGSAVHGFGLDKAQRLHGGYTTADEMAELLVTLLGHNGRGEVLMNEWKPFCPPVQLFNDTDVDRSGGISAKELTDLFKVLNEDPCGGFVELKGKSLKIKAQIPSIPRKCSWLINPQWFYKVPNMSAPLYRTATSMFGILPQMQSPTTVVQSQMRRRLMAAEDGEESEEDHVVRSTENRIAANIPSRRLLAVLPSARVDEEADVITTRAMGTPAAAREIPFSVALMSQSMAHVCDGVLIDPKYVLTTASCALSPNSIAWAIIGGTTGAPGQSGVDQIMVTGQPKVHPSYAIDHTNDVAIVELSVPSSMAPVQIYDGTDVGFTDCRMMQITALSRQSGMLTKKNVTAVPQATCVDHYFWYYGTMGAIGSDVLCVQGDVDNCDATLTKGGALYAVTPAGRPVLLGIKSDISVCNPLPVAYTRISEVRQWILSATNETAVHPATKLALTVDKIMMPQQGTLSVYQGTYQHQANLALHLDSKCQAGHKADDGGMGGLLIVYEPGNALRTAPCGPKCWDEMGFEITVETRSCELNFMAQANNSVGSCNDPFWRNKEGLYGGIAGCAFNEGMGAQGPTCSSPNCEMTARWQALGPMEVAGTAFAGGLGHRMTKNQTHEYGVWTCLRDWNEDEQLRCGVRTNELGCYWFEEKTRVWSWRGANSVARLVEKTRYEQGLDAEETRLARHVLLPGRRALATQHFDM